jgi:short-subunit dehydrogenase
MNMKKRAVGWSAAFVGLAGLTMTVARKYGRFDPEANLSGKVVLITGGSRGLGFAIARELAAKGARLVLTSRHLDELERAKARLVAAGNIAPENIFVHAADVSVAAEIRSLVAAATTYFGQIDVVVNNAGVILVGPVESQALANYQQAMNINFSGALHTTLAVLPQMLARGDGAIVNIGSIGGKVAFPHLLPYVASKFAMTGWSQGLRAELARKGIRVTTVSPGIMRTGSHIQARFSGNARDEYRWFASAASFPGIATDAANAARKVVKAMAKGTPEISIGLQAMAAAHLSNLAPDLTAKVLSFANGFLPGSPDAGDPRFWREDRSVAGEAYRGSLPQIVERLGNKPIKQYNQQALPLQENQRTVSSV